MTTLVAPIGGYRPGDLLVYARNEDLLDRAIRIKTWSDYTHVEVWLGNELVGDICTRLGGPRVSELGIRIDAVLFASRGPATFQWWPPKMVGGGVNLYALDYRPGLVLVRRPVTFDVAAAIDWLSEPGILGQAYDVVGLLNFYLARVQGPENGAMFCSEAGTRLYKRTGTIRAENVDADCVSPRDLAVSEACVNVAAGPLTLR